MTAYYNEFDPYAAQWLRNLIAAGLIAPGVVDERSIEEVTPNDLRGFTQCHFFAGLGGWSYALRRAGWPDERPAWTGSCPCQPFSAAGARAGFLDLRHLWPAFGWLISQCQPAIVFGEQVSSSDVGPWIDLVQADLEALGYAFGGVAFPSAGVGAPHVRDRLYWVANTDNKGLEGWTEPGRSSQVERTTGPSVLAGGLANTQNNGHERPGQLDKSTGRHGTTHLCSTDRPGQVNGFWRNADWLGCRDNKWRPVEPGTFPLANGASSRVGRTRAYGNAVNVEAARIFIEAVMAGEGQAPA